MYQYRWNSRLQLTCDLRIKKGISNQKTCQERNGEAELPKIPYYGNDSFSEELKLGGRNLNPIINSVKFPQLFTFMIWKF